MKIDTLEKLQEFTNVSNDFDVLSLKGYEATAFTKYLDRWFHADLLDQIFAFELEPEASDENKGYKALMHALVAFTMLEYSQHGEIVISQIGFMRSENENAKTAYAQQMKMYRESQEETGFLWINKLIDIMDTALSIFTEWPNSPGYADRNLLLVKTAKKFNSVQRLYRMNTTYIELIPLIREAQDLHLIPKFSQTLIDEMIANDPSMNSNKQIARGYLITAMVNVTMGISLLKGLVKLTPNGVVIIGQDSETSHQLESEAMPEKTSVSYKSYMDTGKRYIDRAYNHLVASGIITQTTFTETRFIG